jgi:alkylresorcinol/alkylpyrone synthase
MRILSAATAFPKHKYSQRVLLEALSFEWGSRLENKKMLERLWANVGVEERYMALPLTSYYGLDTFGKNNDEWIKAAVTLGSQAITSAISRAGKSLADIRALFFVSITGVCSPSIDARLVNAMGLPLNIRRTPIFGLGCVGGAAGISRAADYVRAYPGQLAVLLSVELCAFTLQRDDVSIANQISAGLFGDGSAAVVIGGSDVQGGSGPEIVATQSSFYPETEQVMGWAISEKGFRIVLSPEVPDVILKHLGHDVDAFLAANGLCRAQIGSWVMHTGGPKVLQASQDALGLDRAALRMSWEALRTMGNLSSTSVLAVLEMTMTQARPDPGTWSILAAMGPGFCSELVLLKW